MYNEFDNENYVSGNGMNPDGTTPVNNEDMNNQSQYRMKFNAGECSEQTDDYVNYNPNNNSNDYYGGQNANNQNNTSAYGNYQNDYSYYQQSSPQQPHRPSKKKKSGTGRQLAKVVCFGLVFGLIAGGTMWGVNTLGNMSTGSNKVGESTAGTDDGFTLNVVRTSSKDVETIEGTDVSDIVAEAKPSIVAVTTVVEQTTKDFFGRSYSQEGSGAGSGIIFSEKDGILYIVTNNHVIEDSKEISITFNDGTTANAEIKGMDSKGDIAVLTVDMSQLSDETKSSIKIAVLGDSENVKEGSGAIAIGNALGYGQSTTTGTISALNREVRMTDGTMELLQTDAAINPGNSGGALLNTKGEVIGVNSAKYSDTAVEGMGYAIPINTAIQTVNDIISGKHVEKTDENTACLGIQGGTVNEANDYGIPSGVYVGVVLNNSAAQRAGIQAGYVITGFNGETITTMEQLQGLIEACSPGDEVSITVSIPDQNGKYDQEQTFKTLLGAISESSTNQLQ